MNPSILFDLIGAVELTASAAITVALLSIGFGRSWTERAWLASALGAWFVLVVVFAATEIFSSRHGSLGVGGVGISVVVPLLVLCVAVFRVPSLRSALEKVPLALLIGVNTVRLLGVSFVLLYQMHRLPAPFAPVAGWGDILVGFTALPVAWLAARGGERAPRVILLWNTVGLLDLVAAVGLGVASSPGPLRLIPAEPGSAIMSTLPWLLIPGFLVPLLATTHLAVFYRLRGVQHDRS
jgi:hypothetical protein